MTTSVNSDSQQLTALKKLFLTPVRAKALKSAFAKEGDIALTRLAGSSAPLLMASALLPVKKGVPVLVIGDSLDDAGYLYHDLVRLTSDDNVVILPSGYKRDIKYGRVDPPNQILRTEALARISANDPTLLFVVTYPEALAEKVASRHKVDTNILTFRKSAETDMTEAVKWLREHDFKEVSYVYEPGHFAVRGSILDIFGYSNELPVRIDFFGDEIDSIRSFDIETQLSQQKLDTFTVSANMANADDGNSLLDFIDPATMIFVRDAVHTLSRVREVTGETFSQSAMLADEGDPEVMKNVIDPALFEKSWQSFRHIYFTGGEQVNMPVKATIRFNCVPQALYHKNFDLIAGSFTKMEEDGYTIYLLSDSPKQAERLRQIFADRGDNIRFQPVDGTLHEGFSDGDTKICIFTDHQIFDRFHKYNLRSERARSGKLAMSLKELQAIEPGDYIVHIDHG
ncbi:MAG: transcription-repair coupling factor, partial [Paramuribaculum sp.]|nr:transcription-repair coupling factor [Paramuribaculum sp.]